MNWSDYFYYDESSSSCLRWKIEVRTGIKHNKVACHAGSVAGVPREDSSGSLYYVVGLDYKQYLVHRIVWQLHHELPEDKVLDHENGNSLGNRLANLRLVSSRVNSRNMKMFRTNTSGVTGVSYRVSSDSWSAHIFDENGKRTAKCYAVKKYGAEKAFLLAVAWREAMLKQVNSRGAGYSGRHGLSKE